MGYQNNKFVFQIASDAVSEDPIGNFRVNSTQRIIKQYNISIGINSPGQTDSGFLPTRHIRASLSNDSFKAIIKDFEVTGKLSKLNSLIHSFLIKRFSEHDILFDGV